LNLPVIDRFIAEIVIAIIVPRGMIEAEEVFKKELSKAIGSAVIAERQ
jgi:hypothetical protein